MQNNSNFLSKYSYLIVGFYNIKIENGFQSFETIQGTCFFVRKNKKLFLVSAKHTLTSWNPESSENRKSYPDTLNLRLFDTNGKHIIHPLNIKEINKTITGGYTYNDPDVYVIEFEDNPMFKINSIEGFIDVKTIISSEDCINLYGYNVDYEFFGEKQMQDLPTKEPMLVKGKPLSNESPYRNNNIKQLEELNFAIQRTDSIPRAGCSGAPVFVYKKTCWAFAGIFINSSPDAPVSLILKKEYVLSKLNENL